MHLARKVLLTTTAAAALFTTPPATAAEVGTERVSVGSGEQQGDGFSIRGGLTADGRVVVFSSAATNLVSGDRNGVSDVFVRDRAAGATRLISRGQGGVQGDGESVNPFISRGGRHVAFTSLATNLVPGDTNAAPDVFLRDRHANRTTRVSVGPGGAQANGDSRVRGLSGDGRFVVIGSVATNLVAGDTNGQPDVFVHDRVRRVTTRESVGQGGVEGNGISAAATQLGSGIPGVISGDGRFLAFQSLATNLVPGDANGVADVFLRDRRRGTTELVSVSSDEAQGNGNSVFALVSDDGRFVAFASNASNLVPGDTNGVSDVFLRDRQAGTTTRISVAEGGGDPNGFSVPLTISGNGRYVAYTSVATNIVPGDTNGTNDIFVLDRRTGQTRRLVGDAGEQPNGPSNFPAITPNGRLILFSSEATNLVPATRTLPRTSS
jgi:Tol biopolymer transport system component